MKNVCGISLATLLVFAFVVGFASFSRAADTDGKALYLEKKCNLCHSIDSMGIAKKSEKMKGTDLSDAGNQVSDAAWVKGWIQQTELKDGKKHQKKWNGSDEELGIIVSWVLSLKKS